MTPRNRRISLAAILVLCMISGLVAGVRGMGAGNRVHVVGYFDNSNGIFVGDNVSILGVAVGKVDRIEPQPTRAKISFWFDRKYPVPVDAKAVILSPSLVTSRVIQLTPAYTGGSRMPDGAVIPENRTAVPMEYDNLRDQLQKLTEMLQPTRPGGVSTLGEFVNTAADNLRGQGADIRDALIKMSQAFAVLGDHSQDIFSSVKNLSILVSALQSSTDVMRQLNGNLAAATAVLANDPNEVANAFRDLNAAIGDVRSFMADNRESLGNASDKLAAVTQFLNDALPDVKQLLHIAPTAFQNFINIYQPAQDALTGVLSLNNFADPISFLCGMVQAASRLGAEQAAKLCVQYMAPIAKNRVWNYAPIGENLFIGTQARPNEITYSEDWLRPDYAAPPSSPAAAAKPPAAAPGPPAADTGAPGAEEASAAVSTDPGAGLPGIMTPQAGGS